MEHTSNYQLPQWAESDRIMMQDFNDMAQKIDQGLHAHSGALAQKAEQSALAAEAAARAGADSAEAAARKNDDDALRAAVAARGNCSIGFFTYEGTGVHGADKPTVVAFPRLPAAFIIAGQSGLVIGRGGQPWGMVSSYTNGYTYTTQISMTWSGNTCSFFSINQPAHQMNDRATHMVIAFYAES